MVVYRCQMLPEPPALIEPERVTHITPGGRGFKFCSVASP